MAVLEREHLDMKDLEIDSLTLSRHSHLLECFLYPRDLFQV